MNFKRAKNYISNIEIKLNRVVPINFKKSARLEHSVNLGFCRFRPTRRRRIKSYLTKAVKIK